MGTQILRQKTVEKPKDRRSLRVRWSGSILAFLTVVVSMAIVGPSVASANIPVWSVRSFAAPRNLAPGSTGKIVVDMTNLGDANAAASFTEKLLEFSDKLPPGVTATSIGVNEGKSEGQNTGGFCDLATVSCSVFGVLKPYQTEQIEIGVKVDSEIKSPSTARNEVDVSGGGARPVSNSETMNFNTTPSGFGVEQLEQVALNENGLLDTQAGSHPFGYTTTFQLNEGTSPLPKDLHFNLPPGVIGNPTVVPQCTLEQFSKVVSLLGVNHCPYDTAVGVATIWLDFERGQPGFPLRSPVFNLTPNVGEPARFGFVVLGGVPVILDTSVRTGSDYGVVVSVNNINTNAAFVASQLTLWGVPADPRHDMSRGACIFEGEELSEGVVEPPCPVTSTGGVQAPPFLTLPTSCAGPLRSTVEADSWKEPGVFTSGEYTLHDNLGPVEMDGCNRLPFEPSIKVTPDGQAGSTPTGLTVDEHVPQETTLKPEGLAESDVKGLSVTLPEGVALNPAAADGLQSCSEAQIGLHNNEASLCPDASKVATVKIKTPLLPNPLTGAAYLGAQDQNPFGSLVALYIYAEDPVSGVRAKAAGEVLENPVTGQLTAHFEHDPAFEGQQESSQFLPQLTFEDIELHFFGGDRAPLGTPAHCGSYTTTGSFEPWSGNPAAESSSTFEVTSGPNATPCPGSALPFAPSLTGGTTSIQAGGFTPFEMTMSREDGQQDLKSVQLHMPPGLLGLVSSLTPCGEAAADAGSCGPESLLGHTTVSVGLGGNPYSVTGGQVFLTGPYESAPYGLSIVVPAKAGPFNLGHVVVRAKIEVDPLTANLTVTTDTTGPYAIPHILDGIPLQIKHVNVSIDRPGFIFNPTDCEKLQMTGTLASIEGANSTLNVPFQVTNCAVLGFKPHLSVSTSGKPSRKNGTSLTIKLAYPKGALGKEAWFRSAKFAFPKQLPARLSTLQKACPSATFNANPAACSAESHAGTAIVHTPVLPGALQGVVYFVSYGDLKFPEAVIVLQGDNVTVDLHAETFINEKTGVTSATLRSIPGVPFESVEVNLPAGPYSEFASTSNPCTTKLKMPFAFTAQNGLSIHQTNTLAVTGCPRHKTKKKAHKTSRHRGKK